MQYLKGDRILLPVEHHAPLVTILDGDSCALAFIGSALGTRAIRLGVDDFGQSGTRGELYDYYESGPPASSGCGLGPGRSPVATVASYHLGPRFPSSPRLGVLRRSFAFGPPSRDTSRGAGAVTR